MRLLIFNKVSLGIIGLNVVVSLIRFEHYVVGEWWVGGSRVLVLSLRLELNNYQYYIIKQFNVI